MTVAVVATLAFSIVAAVFAARAIFMLAFRTEVRGKTVGHDYSRELRNRDEDLRLVDIARWHNSHGNRPPPRAVTLRVDYSYNGKAYRNDVHGWVRRGGNPSRLVSLWIDPRNPNKVTAQGPAHWSSGMLLFAIGAILAARGENAAVNTITCLSNQRNCRFREEYNDLKPLGPDAWKHKQSPSDVPASF